MWQRIAWNCASISPAEAQSSTAWQVIFTIVQALLVQCPGYQDGTEVANDIGQTLKDLIHSFGAEVTSNGNLGYWYNPWCTLMVRNCLDSSARGICWYAYDRSSFLIFFPPVSFTIRSSEIGFRLLCSYHICKSPFTVWGCNKLPSHCERLCWSPTLITVGSAPFSMAHVRQKVRSEGTQKCLSRALQLILLWSQSSAPLPPRKPQCAPAPLHLLA